MPTLFYPIYAQIIQMYQEATGNKLNYQSIGSGGGVKRVKAKLLILEHQMPL